MNQTERAQSCATVKIEQSQYDQTENTHEKVKQESKDKKIDTDQIFSRQSEVNWNINNGGIDNMSLRSFRSSSTNKSSKRPPNQQDLCNAILTLRKKLPQRSLQQIIIRLHQSINHKKQSDAISNRSKKSKIYEPSVCSRRDDFDDSKSFAGIFSFNFEKLNDQDISKGFFEGEQSNSLKYDESNRLKHDSNHIKRMKDNQEEDQMQGMNDMNRQNQIPQAGINYIYRPSGQEIIVEYLEQKTKKVNFINIQQETRYIERRVMAKSFIQRGYGVSQCRKEIQAQNLSIQMHRNTYKTLAGSVIILAFRKLQSFIANECCKSIKYLDRWQMRSICTTMLNCRTNMEPQQMETLFKYVRASYGLGDIRIGQIQSVKLYLAIQKNIHGKNVTIETLEKIGEIQQKKNIDLTHQYLKRKKLKRQQRLQKLRKLRIEVKQQRRKEMDQNKQQTYKILQTIELNCPELKLQMQALSNSQGNSTLRGSNTVNQSVVSESREDSISHLSMSEAQNPQSKQQQCWSEQFDKQYISVYLEDKSMLNAINALQEAHQQLINWSVQLFEKKFCKIIKKSVKKIQIQSQMSQDSDLPVLNRLDKEQIKKLLYSPSAQIIRHQLLQYFLLDQPNIQMLIEVVASTNIFFYGFSQGPSTEKKRGRGRPRLNLKTQSTKPFNYYPNIEKGYFSYKSVQNEQEGESINFSEEFAIQQQELRKTFGQHQSQIQDNFDYLDIDTNDLRIELQETQPSAIYSQCTSNTQVKIQAMQCESKIYKQSI